MTDLGANELIDRLRSILVESARGDGTMPSEPALATELGASRPALREALTRLEVEGLLSRRRGAATIINRQAHSIPARFDQQVEFMNVIADAGHLAGLDVIEAAVVPMAEESASILGRSPGSASFRTVKRWTADGRAVLVAVDEIPLDEGCPSLEPSSSLFDNVKIASGSAVEWEIARPGAMISTGELSSWIDGTDQALLVLDLLGLARSGTRLYRAVEYHVPGAVDFGFVRTMTDHQKRLPPK